MILTTLKNLIEKRYNSQSSPLPVSQKMLLRDELLRMFYVANEHPRAIKLMKQIMHSIILVDFPWESIKEELDTDLGNGKVAAVYMIRQVAKVNEYIMGKDRIAFEGFIEMYFPRL